MHDVLKERISRKLEALPQEQVYQVLDYIEFLEAKYARDAAARPDMLQRFAERVEDSLRMRSVAPKVISGTVGLLGTARRVVRTVSDAGRDLLGEGGTVQAPRTAARNLPANGGAAEPRHTPPSRNTAVSPGRPPSPNATTSQDEEDRSP